MPRAEDIRAGPGFAALHKAWPAYTQAEAVRRDREAGSRNEPLPGLPKPPIRATKARDTPLTALQLVRRSHITPLLSFAQRATVSSSFPLGPGTTSSYQRARMSGMSNSRVRFSNAVRLFALSTLMRLGHALDSVAHAQQGQRATSAAP